MVEKVKGKRCEVKYLGGTDNKEEREWLDMKSTRIRMPTGDWDKQTRIDKGDDQEGGGVEGVGVDDDDDDNGGAQRDGDEGDDDEGNFKDGEKEGVCVV